MFEKCLKYLKQRPIFVIYNRRLRDRAVGQLVWLITTRSLVRIQFPLQKGDVKTQ